MKLPDDFIRYTRQLMGDELFTAFTTALDEQPPVSVHMNPWKQGGSSLATENAETPIPWCQEGVYFSKRPLFTFDPLLHAGTYYVQDAASMFLAHILQQYVDHPVRVLDLCAAPGGKSITALTTLPSGSLLFANEPHHTRACILAENLAKVGNPDVVVTQNMPADYHRSHLRFDVIIVDAPCSGEGMFRKDPASVSEWSTSHVENCSRLQRSILTEAWHCLQPGGLLIYSTCTLNRKENEDNVAWMEQEMGAQLLPVPVQPDWHITESLSKEWEGTVFRFIPGISKGEGMFFAVMRKPGTDTLPSSVTTATLGRRQRNKERNHYGNADMSAAFLKESDRYKVYSLGGKQAAIPKRWWPALQEAAGLRILQAGVVLGQWKGRDFVPDPVLALSIALDKSKTANIEVEHDMAIEYLRKSPQFILPTNTPRGMMLITHQGHPLGWAKHLGTRTNNLYPNEWRILKARPDNL